jgi:hypothetical protein
LVIPSLVSRLWRSRRCLGLRRGVPGEIGEDDPDEEGFLRSVWEEGDDRGFVVEVLKSGVEVRTGRP